MLSGTDRFPTKKWILFSCRFLLAKLFPFWQTRLIPVVTERQTSIVPPIVETKSPITRGRTMIKSLEIGTLPFAYASTDPSLHPPSNPVSNQRLTNVFFPSSVPSSSLRREIKRCLAEIDGEITHKNVSTQRVSKEISYRGREIFVS